MKTLLEDTVKNNLNTNKENLIDIQNRLSKRLNNLIVNRKKNGVPDEKKKKNFLNRSFEKLTTIGSKILSNVSFLNYSFKKETNYITNSMIDEMNESLDASYNDIDDKMFDASSEMEQDDVQITKTNVMKNSLHNISNIQNENDRSQLNSRKIPSICSTHEINNDFLNEITKEVLNEIIEIIETVTPSIFF